jgi:hypothetical protein
MYYVYGDYGYTSETLLEEFEFYENARRWVDGYTEAGDFGGWSVIEIARFAGDEYVVEYRVEAEDYQDYDGQPTTYEEYQDLYGGDDAFETCSYYDEY